MMPRLKGMPISLLLSPLLVLLTRCSHAFVPAINKQVPIHWSSVLQEKSSIASIREECEATDFAEGSLTSTYSEGTPDTDIVLSWEPDMAETVRTLLSEKQTEGPLLIGVVGNPGSGTLLYGALVFHFFLTTHCLLLRQDNIVYHPCGPTWGCWGHGDAF